MDSITESAAWEIPLTDPQLACIGAIAVMWAFVEIQIDLMLQNLHGIDPEQFKSLFGEKQIGSKIDALKSASKRAHTKSVGTQIAKICDRLKSLAADRNHVIHGRWGYQLVKNKKGEFVTDLRPSASTVKKRPPFPADRLPLLVKNVAEITLSVDDSFNALLGNDDVRPARGRRFFFGNILTPSEAKKYMKPPARPPNL